MNDEAITKFGQNLRGALIGRSHADYDEARKLYNGMIDKRPLLIARCADVADVITSVNFGRDNKLPVAIRGGGHNGPGLGSVDDGLVIDLSTMKGVRVDPAKRTVRVEAGCVTGDIDHATHAFGLAIPFGVVSTTGVAGLSSRAATATSAASTGSPSTICSKPTWCSPMPASSRLARRRTPISCGPFAAAAGISVW
jgi:FAD/FMN-containing dehydrogenase